MTSAARLTESELATRWETASTANRLTSTNLNPSAHQISLQSSVYRTPIHASDQGFRSIVKLLDFASAFHGVTDESLADVWKDIGDTFTSASYFDVENQSAKSNFLGYVGRVLHSAATPNVSGRLTSTSAVDTLSNTLRQLFKLRLVTTDLSGATDDEDFTDFNFHIEGLSAVQTKIVKARIIPTEPRLPDFFAEE